MPSAPVCLQGPSPQHENFQTITFSPGSGTSRPRSWPSSPTSTSSSPLSLLLQSSSLPSLLFVSSEVAVMPSLKVCFSIKGTLAPPFGGNINDAETKSSFPGLPEWIDLNIIVPVSATIIVVCVGILVVCVALSRRKTPPLMNPGLVSRTAETPEKVFSPSTSLLCRGVRSVLRRYEHDEERRGDDEEGRTSIRRDGLRAPS